jgi:hypothetical protein
MAEVSNRMEAASEYAKYRIYSPRVINAGSKQRFLRDRTAMLVKHIGGEPSRAQMVLIRRAAEVEWLLTKFDHEDALSAHDARVYLSLHNTLTRTVALIDSTAPKTTSSTAKPAPAPKPEPSASEPEQPLSLVDALMIGKASPP